MTFGVQNETQYEGMLKEAQYFVANPKNLLADIALKAKDMDRARLIAPAPVQYPYRLMRYKGFIKYPERLKNYLLAENEPRDVRRGYLPHIMDIEPNSRCNFRCIMCQVSKWKNGKRADDLSWSEFQEFVSEFLPILTEVKLHGMGDPLLNEQYFEMVRYLVDHDIWVRTSINGALLHLDEKYKHLIDSGIGEVQCSFDGATKEIYEKIRRGGHFETIVKNYTTLNEYANKKSRLYTRLWVLLQADNCHQLFDFVEMAKRMGFRRLTFSVTLNDWGQEQWKGRNEIIRIKTGISLAERERLAALSANKEIDISIWEQAAKYSVNNVNALCPWPFSRPYITSDLRIVPCCMIANPEVIDLGSAKCFRDRWNSAEYQAFRQAHLVGAIPKCCQGCYGNK